MKKEFQDQLNRIEVLLKEQKEKPLTFDEACKYIGLSKSSMYKLTFRGLISHYKPNGKLIYFTKEDLDNWLLRNKIESKELIEKIADNYIKYKGPVI